MKKIIVLICLLLSVQVYGQDLKLKWSPKIKFDNKGMGDFEEFVGANENYVYAKYENTYVKGKKVYLVAFDKSTMRKVGKSRIFSTSKKRKGRQYERTVVTKEAIYVVYKDDAKGSEKMYVAAYSPTLRRLASPKMVKRIQTSKKRGSQFRSSIVARSNYKAGNNIYILAEQESLKDESTKLEYLVLNEKLETVKDDVIELPVLALRNSTSKVGRYSIEEDGKIYSTFKIIPSKAERRKKKRAFVLLNIVDPMNNELVTLPVKAEGRDVIDFSFAGDKQGTLKIFGFYADLDRKKRTHGIDGVFSSILNTSSGDITNSKFTPISSSMLGQLFKDRVDKKTVTRKKKKKNRDRTLSGNYEIEAYDMADDGSITMFCTHEYNYVVTTYTRNANGGGTTQTTPYCQQTNVTAIKFNVDGTMDWIENIPRSITYLGHYIDDISVVETSDKFVVTYGSGFQEERKKGLFKRRKRRKDMDDAIEYASFAKADGSSKKNTLVVYKKGTDKRKKNLFNPAKIQAYNDRFYLNGSNLKQRPGIVAASCITAPICIGCGIYYLTMRSGSLFKGYNQFAVIEPIK